jgi:adenine-specific DNA-methyltransferase
MPNDWYVLVRRFSSKEEKRRIVAYVFDPRRFESEWIGFENHWNVFHSERRGLDPAVARGVACFLNSTMVDRHFRLFSGHTQVNATDLRNMKYPYLDTLRAYSSSYTDDLTQSDIDHIVRAA